MSAASETSRNCQSYPPSVGRHDVFQRCDRLESKRDPGALVRIVLTGATGLLATYLRGPLLSRGDIIEVSRTASGERSERCDLADANAVAAMLDNHRPDLIVHLAALTNVDECETDPLAAYRANVRGTSNLADWVEKNAPETRFVYVSTDQVYDAPGPSTEEAVRPRNVYALTKLWGEDHARKLANALVLRVNFFAGPEAGLVAWLMRQHEGEGSIKLFSDVLFNPLHVHHLAECMCELIDRKVVGTFNLGASGDGSSKAEFLRAAANILGLADCRMQDCSVADVALRAYRPRDMRMSISSTEQALGRDLPTIQDGLALLGDDDNKNAD